MKKCWNEADHLVVAVSTGIDSMVLLHQLLHDYRHTYRSLTCLHVHHGLRANSTEEASFITQYCEAQHIPVYIHYLDLKDIVASGRSIQNEARIQRYDWFDTMMDRLNADCLLTAHHQDDQIETIFYRVFTGRSTRSALGISHVEQRQGYRLVRPLLDHTKADIVRYQQRYQVPYFEDESNASNDYVRNDIRNRILPAIHDNQQLQAAQLLKLNDYHDTAQRLIEQQATSFIDQYVAQSAQLVSLPKKVFNQELLHVKIKVLDLLFAQFEPTSPVTEKAYFDWFNQLEQDDIAQTTLMRTNQWKAMIVYDKLIIMSASALEDVQQEIHTTSPGYYEFGPYRIYLSNHLFNVSDTMTIRSRRNGDRVELDTNHHKKVSRLMIDAKIPQFLREHMPIVEDATHQILAVGTLYTHFKYQEMINIHYLGDDFNGK